MGGRGRERRGRGAEMAMPPLVFYSFVGPSISLDGNTSQAWTHLCVELNLVAVEKDSSLLSQNQCKTYRVAIYVVAEALVWAGLFAKVAFARILVPEEWRPRWRCCFRRDVILLSWRVVYYVLTVKLDLIPNYSCNGFRFGSIVHLINSLFLKYPFWIWRLFVSKFIKIVWN